MVCVSTTTTPGAPVRSKRKRAEVDTEKEDTGTMNE
jgi:hypothetical protein